MEFFHFFLVPDFKYDLFYNVTLSVFVSSSYIFLRFFPAKPFFLSVQFQHLYDLKDLWIILGVIFSSLFTLAIVMAFFKRKK